METVVGDVLSEYEYWPEALDSLDGLVSYRSDRLDAGTAERVRRLLADLAPKNLKSRVRFLVTDMPRDYRYVKDMEFSVLEELQNNEVRETGEGAIGQPSSTSLISISGQPRRAAAGSYSRGLHR